MSPEVEAAKEEAVEDDGSLPIDPSAPDFEAVVEVVAATESTAVEESKDPDFEAVVEVDATKNSSAEEVSKPQTKIGWRVELDEKDSSQGKVDAEAPVSLATSALRSLDSSTSSLPARFSTISTPSPGVRSTLLTPYSVLD